MTSTGVAGGVTPRPRWMTFLAMTLWMATVAMGLATVQVSLFTRFIDEMTSLNGVTPTPGDLLVFRASVLCFFALVVAYATVGALLAGRTGAGRIAALLLAGGFLFALVPFGYAIGGTLTIADPSSPLFNAILLLGPVAIGPAFATVLPGLAIAFPDGRLPSPRWRWPVGGTIVVIAVGTLLNLIEPGPVAGGTTGRNPLGVDGIPEALQRSGYGAVFAGILAITGLGVASVVARFRAGNPTERQQQRWFLGAVSVAALPLVLFIVPGTGGPAMGIVAALGLILVPIAVGVAVTRYRLYEIDNLINRTLVYVPLTALLAGLYAASVALMQRVFQSVTGDKSDAAIVISTLVLASVFTPLRKWLEGIVERRFKPGATVIHETDGPEWEARVAEVALRVVRAELGARTVPKPPAKPVV